MLGLAEAEDEEMEEDDSDSDSDGEDVEGPDADHESATSQVDMAEASEAPVVQESQDDGSPSNDIHESDDDDGVGRLSGHANALRLDDPPAPAKDVLRKLVSSEVSRERARNSSKYHSRRGPGQAGRAKGSKAKQDTRVKVDKGGIWG